MAHTATIPALSLSRAVFGSVATAAVIRGAVLIASTARKALSYWSGFVLGGSPCHSGREAGSGRAGFMRLRQRGGRGVLSGQARGEIRLWSPPPGGGATDLSNVASRRGRDVGGVKFLLLLADEILNGEGCAVSPFSSSSLSRMMATTAAQANTTSTVAPFCYPVAQWHNAADGVVREHHRRRRGWSGGDDKHDHQGSNEGHCPMRDNLHDSVGGRCRGVPSWCRTQGRRKQSTHCRHAMCS